ncbi:MAG: DUF357 domain-containing protein [Nanobdellota archaeon]
MDNKTSEITKERLDKYFDITGRALKKAKIVPEKVNLDSVSIAKDFYQMAETYFNDAKHFANEGKIVLAYGALNYAHAWLDAGARIGIFDVDGDNVLFTVD